MSDSGSSSSLKILSNPYHSLIALSSGPFTEEEERMVQLAKEKKEARAAATWLDIVLIR